MYVHISFISVYCQDTSSHPAANLININRETGEGADHDFSVAVDSQTKLLFLSDRTRLGLLHYSKMQNNFYLFILPSRILGLWYLIEHARRPLWEEASFSVFSFITSFAQHWCCQEKAIQHLPALVPLTPPGYSYLSPSKNEGTHLCPLGHHGVWISNRLVPTYPRSLHPPFTGIPPTHPSQLCPQWWLQLTRREHIVTRAHLHTGTRRKWWS